MIGWPKLCRVEHLRTFGPPGDPTNPTLWRDPDADADQEFVLIDGDGKMIRTSREGLEHLVTKAQEEQ